MSFKNTDKKFVGNVFKCWQKFKDEFEQVAENYNLSHEQQFRFLHNILCKDAHRFYVETMKPFARNYGEAVMMPEKSYNSVVR